jgi:hypothetical protein
MSPPPGTVELPPRWRPPAAYTRRTDVLFPPGRRSGPSFKRVGRRAHARPPRCALRRYKHTDNCQAEGTLLGRLEQQQHAEWRIRRIWKRQQHEVSAAGVGAFRSLPGGTGPPLFLSADPIRRRIRPGSALETQSKLGDQRSSEILWEARRCCCGPSWPRERSGWRGVLLRSNRRWVAGAQQQPRGAQHHPRPTTRGSCCQRLYFPNICTHLHSDTPVIVRILLNIHLLFNRMFYPHVLSAC